MPEKNENRITLGPGTLYLNNEKFGEISEANCTVEPDDIPILQTNFELIGHACEEFSCSIKMATDAFTRFCHVITGIGKHLRESCPNRKVVHLAYRARKARTRKKNYRRMIRICEENGK